VKKTIGKHKSSLGTAAEFEIIAIPGQVLQSEEILAALQRTDYYHVIWIEQGAPVHSVDFSPMTIPAHTILFVPQDRVHLFDLSGEYQGRAILFSAGFFAKNHCDMQYLHSTILFNELYGLTQLDAGESPELEGILASMENELDKPGDPVHYDILRNLLHNFLLQAQREKRRQGFRELTSSAELDNVIRFLDLLERNFRSDKLVGKYMTAMNITEKRLNKSTTLILDKTPKQLIDERVSLEAKRLLARSHASIRDIAFDLGFEERSSFIKFFVKHNGCKPAEFRERQILVSLSKQLHHD
jgi:AraC-like DNA-binding protein